MGFGLFESILKSFHSNFFGNSPLFPAKHERFSDTVFFVFMFLLRL